MFKWFQKKNDSDTQNSTKTAPLTETQIRLRAGFYEEPKEDPNASEFARMLTPKCRAHQLYKELAAFGQQQGWISDCEKYPLMYELLYSAEDTALAVDWRMQKLVDNDDENHSKSFYLALAWCAYVAMADAYLCHKDWEALRSRGLIYMIEDVCGFNYVDEYVVKQLHFNDDKALRQHLQKVADLAKQPFVESASSAAPIQRQESLTAMYYYGMTLAMQKLNLL
ncbi:MAG: hypothetical protein SOY30_15715 [Eubacteriales bacterium]|nr:hypothetical protein [Eubacteriales bacterium]